MEKINIVCACDKQYLPFTAAMICSVFENNRHNTIVVYLLHDGLKVSLTSRLKRISRKYDQSIIPILVSPKTVDRLTPSVSLTSAQFFRLFAGTLLPLDIGKVLYFDSDLIIRRDLSELWNTNIDDYPLAAAEDIYGPRYLDRLGLPESCHYFNSGMMLINLDWWRQSNLQNEVLNIIRSNRPKLRYMDQDALNVVVNDNWYRLPTTWNMVYIEKPTREYLERFSDGMSNPAIVHFTGGARHSKPWHPLCRNPYRFEYRYYQKKTPWKTALPHYFQLIGHLLKDRFLHNK